MTFRRTIVVALAAVAVAAVIIAGVLANLSTRGTPPSDPNAAGQSGTVAPSSSTQPSSPVPPSATTIEQASTAFLDGYVDPDGRVVRRDQGNDTVSEGQAYAMLVAVAVGDQTRFASVWQWTKANLQRPDGLLSWRWQDGAVLDAESASDADLDAARALVLAGTTFSDSSYTEAGNALGQAILDHETKNTSAGRILIAGTWATAEPYGYNPSYASPGATAVLAKAKPDSRWAELDEGSLAISKAGLENADLPPDWAQVHRDGQVDPMPGAAGRGNDGVRYGYDATRMPIRFAESCTDADVALAGELATPLDRFPGAFAARDLGGQPLTQDESVVAAAGQAAAYAAAGNETAARSELTRMAQLEQRSPTYYGAAWNALGRIMLTSDVLGGCPPVSA